MQSKRASFIEACIGILIGYWVAFFAQMLIFPWFGLSVSVQDNLLIGLAFTVVSIVRSYYVRRFFNWLHTKGVLK